MLVGDRLRFGELAGAAGTPVELGDRESAIASAFERVGGSLFCAGGSLRWEDATRAASSSTSSVIVICCERGASRRSRGSPSAELPGGGGGRVGASAE